MNEKPKNWKAAFVQYFNNKIEPKEETDWSKVPKGTLVEVLCNTVNDGWRPAYYGGFDPSIELCHWTQDSAGVLAGGAKYCRLLKHDGGGDV